MAASLSFAAVAAFTACADDEEQGGLQFESPNLKLTAGTTQKMKVMNGMPAYNVFSTDSTVAIATAMPDGIEVAAKKHGTALVFVSDAYKQAGSFAVVVEAAPEE